MHEESGQLPEVRNALLDHQGVSSLFSDIRSLTRVDQIMVKHQSASTANEPCVSLLEAERMLISGEARGVQIRYFHDGANWFDTLMCVANGIRLVRIRHDSDSSC